MILEICAFNIQSCFIAEQGGAQRIELCADPLQGGTTPSHGLLQYAMEYITIPIFPMIRPRGGNFIYDAHELSIMQKDIQLCKSLGYPGIATGVQLPGGKIDVYQLKQITEWAYPMSVTCHKVFDGAPDAAEALEAVIAAGCARILTSGLQKTATDGAGTIAQLIAQAAGRIIIMPGGGVRSSNISQLVRDTGAHEYHSSALVARVTNHIADKQEVRLLGLGIGN
jgi:copper homeostasis protein